MTQGTSEERTTRKRKTSESLIIKLSMLRVLQIKTWKDLPRSRRRISRRSFESRRRSSKRGVKLFKRKRKKRKRRKR